MSRFTEMLSNSEESSSEDVKVIESRSNTRKTSSGTEPDTNSEEEVRDVGSEGEPKEEEITTRNHDSGDDDDSASSTNTPKSALNKTFKKKETSRAKNAKRKVKIYYSSPDEDEDEDESSDSDDVEGELEIKINGKTTRVTSSKSYGKSSRTSRISKVSSKKTKSKGRSKSRSKSKKKSKSEKKEKENTIISIYKVPKHKLKERTVDGKKRQVFVSTVMLPF